MSATTDEPSKAGATVSDVSYVNGWAVLAEIAVHHGAVSDIAVSSDGARAMVTHHGDDSFSLIDIGDPGVAQTIVGIDEPFAIAMSDTAGRAYVSSVSAAYDSILAFDVDARRVVAAHPVAHSVTDLAVSPDGRYLYASRSSVHGADVAILDTQTGAEDAIGIAESPGTTTERVRVSPDGRRLYVATNGPSGAELVVIDALHKRVVTAVEIGSPIRDLALSADAATAYVASCGVDLSAVLDVVDTRANVVTSTYKVGEVAGFVTRLTLSRDGERAYLVGDDSVTVLSTAAHDVIGSIVVGAPPSCVIESLDGTCLYIGDYAGTVTVVEIASAAPSVNTPYDDATSPHQWVLPDLLGLEPALA